MPFYLRPNIFTVTIDPTQIPTKDLHQLLLAAVAPRPIAWASTISAEGAPNLAPFSFFNAFSSNPPILVFSANRRVENNTTKDTLANIEQTGEVVINVVNHALVRQMALTSVEYPAGVSEFEKAGLTLAASELVRPYRVAESPVQMECRVEQILRLGDGGGAGNLFVCHVLRMHIHDEVLDDRGRINVHKIDLVARMGRFYYCRASGDAIFEIEQPVKAFGIGFDALPAAVRHSKILSGNDLGWLAAQTQAPDNEAIEKLKKSDRRVRRALSSENPEEAIHRLAKREIAKKNYSLALAAVFIHSEI